MLNLTSTQAASLLESISPGSTIYLVGIGGCGMSGLGHLLLDLGFRVEGSDLASNDDTRGLVDRGARVQVGHDAGRLQEVRPALVAYAAAFCWPACWNGSAASAVPACTAKPRRPPSSPSPWKNFLPTLAMP